MIKKTGGKQEWCVYTASGDKKIACHPTYKEALQQLRAIEASKHNRGDTIFCEDCLLRFPSMGDLVAHYIRAMHGDMQQQAALVDVMEYPNRWVHIYSLKDGVMVPPDSEAGAYVMRIFSTEHLLKTLYLTESETPSDKALDLEAFAMKTEGTELPMKDTEEAKVEEALVKDTAARASFDKPPVEGPDGELGWWITMTGGRRIFVKSKSPGVSWGTIGKIAGGLSAVALVGFGASVAITYWRARKSGALTALKWAGIGVAGRSKLVLGQSLTNLFSWGKAAKAATAVGAARIGAGMRSVLGSGVHAKVVNPSSVKKVTFGTGLATGKLKAYTQSLGIKASYTPTTDTLTRQEDSFSFEDFFDMANAVCSGWLYAFDSLLSVKNENAIKFYEAIQESFPSYLAPATRISESALAEAGFFDGCMNMLTGIYAKATDEAVDMEKLTPEETYEAGMWLDKTNFPVDAFLSALGAARLITLEKE